MLIDELKKANMDALKTKNQTARSVLAIVINRYNLLEIELRSKGESIDDGDLVKIIQKVGRELDEEKSGYLQVKNASMVEEIEKQKEVIEVYLPKMLSREEIVVEIEKLEDKAIPSVMKHFKTNFDGKVDMKLVNEVLRTLK